MGGEEGGKRERVSETEGDAGRRVFGAGHAHVCFFHGGTGAYAHVREAPPHHAVCMVDTSTHHDALLEVLEGLVAGDALVLLERTVDADGREAALLEELVEKLGALHLRYEDDDLVELERVEEVVQLAVLLVLLQLDVVLLEAVESQLRLVVDVDLHRLG